MATDPFPMNTLRTTAALATATVLTMDATIVVE